MCQFIARIGIVSLSSYNYNDFQDRCSSLIFAQIANWAICCVAQIANLAMLLRHLGFMGSPGADLCYLGNQLELLRISS